MIMGRQRPPAAPGRCRRRRLLQRATRRALTAQQAFWKLLLRDHIYFNHLTTSFNSIEDAQQQAVKAYHMVLGRWAVQRGGGGGTGQAHAYARPTLAAVL